MAFKGTAGKSASGASMSKYDVEVEGRLSALEAKVNKDPGSDLSSSDKLDLLIELLGQNDIFVSRVPKKYKGFFGA